MTTLGDSLGVVQEPGSNLYSGLRAPREDRPRCRRRAPAIVVVYGASKCETSPQRLLRGVAEDPQRR